MQKSSERPPASWAHRVPLQHACSVCGGGDGLVLGTLEYALFDGAKIASKFDVTCCSQCGFVTCNTPSTQSDYDAFYTASFYSPEYIARELSEKEKRYFAETVDILSQITDDKAMAIFDIGCGVGSLIETLRCHGYTNLYGVDPSTACVKLLTEQKGIRCEQGTIASIPFLRVAPQLIILSHIIEHLIDIKPSISHVRSRLALNGMVYVEVPDAMRYAEFSLNNPLSFFYFQHVIHFDHRQLCNLFAAHGFREVKSGYRQREEKSFTMPCIWTVFKKEDSSRSAVIPDFTLAQRIKDWFDNTSLDPQGQFSRLAVSQSPVYVWGIGIHAQMMLAMSPLRECNIKALVDKNEELHDKTIRGRKIVSLDVLERASEDEVVVIAAVVHKDMMYKYLREELKFKGQIISL